MYRQFRHLENGYKLRGGDGKTRVKKKGLGQPGELRNTPLVSRFHLDENGRSVERSTYVQQPFQA